MELFRQKMAFKRAMLQIVPEMACNLNRWHFGLVSAINNMLPAGSPSEACFLLQVELFRADSNDIFSDLPRSSFFSTLLGDSRLSSSAPWTA